MGHTLSARGCPPQRTTILVGYIGKIPMCRFGSTLTLCEIDLLVKLDCVALRLPFSVTLSAINTLRFKGDRHVLFFSRRVIPRVASGHSRVLRCICASYLAGGSNAMHIFLLSATLSYSTICYFTEGTRAPVLGRVRRNRTGRRATAE